MCSSARDRIILRQLKSLIQDSYVQSYFYYESSEKIDNSQQFCIYGYLLPRSVPYKYGSYKVRITIPSDFPFRRPKTDLLTRIYHPAVNNSLAICYCSACCNKEWSPAITISKMIELFVVAIDHPEDAGCYCVMDKGAKQLHDQNRIEYEAKALAMVKAFSCSRPNPALISLKLAVKRIICQQLYFDPVKINQLPLSNSLKQYLDPSINSS